ncbi:hypothetical protein [Psychrobacter alimentarius]|uniref:hypothetical protein n=1 Tax=Psychrobacter alimentarius TaxID=261164 RepID=UPI001919B4BA|nr:hypothetical protein [Psychrobacter alimentarius]
MKKYQKIIKDNIDLISEIEVSLLDDIAERDNVPDGYLRSIYIASGALELIDENYDFSELPMRVSEVFANMIHAYAACAYDGKISHEHKMHCFDLSTKIKDNIQWHRMREPMFNGS